MTVLAASRPLFRLALEGRVHHRVVHTGRAARALSRSWPGGGHCCAANSPQSVGSGGQNAFIKIAIIPDKAISVLIFWLYFFVSRSGPLAISVVVVHSPAVGTTI